MIVIHEEEPDNSTESEDLSLLYYIPLFKHPIPLIHLENNNATMHVRVVFENDAIIDTDIHPLYTLLNDKLHKWLNTRNLLLTLKDNDLLRVGPKKVTIVEVEVI